MDTHTPKFKIRLGLFIITGFALFAIAIFFIGKQDNLFDPVFKIRTNFYNVSGLMVGNNIRFSGINVGTVDDIKIINDSTVQVDMLIRKNVQQFIKADSEAAIGSEGIIGDRILVITQGSIDAPTVKNGQRIESVEPIETDAIMESLSTTAANAEIISHQMANVMVDINNGKGTLGRLIRDTDIADNLSSTMANLKASSKGLDENMQAAQNSILLKGFFNKKEKAAAKKLKAEKKAAEKKAADELKAAEKNAKAAEKEAKKNE
ncbi:MAG: MCE family protein [Saprospiraceae bacterium]|nr:MCE family protein [Saprospiraceae bacterium]